MIKPIATFKLSCTDIEHSNLSSPSTDDSPNTPTFSGNRPEMYDCVQYTKKVDIYLDFIIAYINLFSLHIKEGKSESSLMDESTTSSLGILNPSVIESQV